MPSNATAAENLAVLMLTNRFHGLALDPQLFGSCVLQFWRSCRG
jgi:hypothetical protein